MPNIFLIPGGAGLGVPSFTYDTNGSGSGGSPVTTYTFTPNTPQRATRFVVVFLLGLANPSAQSITSASFNIGGTPVTASFVNFFTDGGGQSGAVLYAIVPVNVAGTITLDATWDGNTFGTGESALYTADSSQFVSLTPVTAAANPVNSPANAAVAITSGGAIIAGGGTASGPTSIGFTTPNDPPVSLDNTFGTTNVVGHKNNCSAFTGAHVTMFWSGGTNPGGGHLMLAAWR